MTPEEINALDALVKAATPEFRLCFDDGITDDATGERGKPAALYGPDGVWVADFDCGMLPKPQADAIGRSLAALHNATPTLIAAARQVAGYQAECHEIDQTLGRALGYPPNPDGAGGVCTGEHTPASLAAEAAGVVERLRAFVPVWRREDEHTLHLTLGPVALGGVMGPHPESGLWGAMATGDDGVTEHPDLPTAAAAVCARLGIPSVGVGDV